MKTTKYSPLELITLAAIAAVLLWPVPVDSSNGPLRGLATIIFEIVGYNPTTYFIVEKTSNLLLFIPLGYIVAKHARTTKAIAITIGISIAAELAQKFIITARVFAIDDIIANSIGALIGVYLFKLLFNRAKTRGSNS